MGQSLGQPNEEFWGKDHLLEESHVGQKQLSPGTATVLGHGLEPSRRTHGLVRNMAADLARCHSRRLSVNSAPQRYMANSFLKGGPVCSSIPATILPWCCMDSLLQTRSMFLWTSLPEEEPGRGECKVLHLAVAALSAATGSHLVLS